MDVRKTRLDGRERLGGSPVKKDEIGEAGADNEHALVAEISRPIAKDTISWPLRC